VFRFLCLFLLFNQLTYAEIYRCTNTNGKVAFQDKPCESNVKEERVKLSNSVNSISSDIVSINNLVKNHGFANGLDHWIIPDRKPNKQGIYHRDRIDAHTSAVLELAAVKPPDDKYIHTTLVEQCVYLERGQTFTLSADVLLDEIISKPSANRLNIVWYESDDCSNGGQFGWYLEPQKRNGWQTLRLDNLRPSLSASSARIEITQNGRFSEGVSAYWDNVSLKIKTRSPSLKTTQAVGETLATGKNYLKNPSFSKDLSSWRVSQTATWVDAYPHKGTVMITSRSSTGSIGSGAFSQCINFGTNKRFAMGIRFKRDPDNQQDGGGRLRTTWYTEANCKGYGKTKYDADPKPGSGWQKLSVNNMEAPQGSVSVRFSVIQSIAGPGSFSVYWDDAYFYRSY
jgi:hypothetical protein